jgi:hypothetical protein
MNGMEKTHCLKELSKMEIIYKKLKEVEEQLQNQFEETQINNPNL